MTNVDLAEAQPSFLRRTPAKENTAMTPAPTPTKAPKTKRRDAYVATIKVQIPLTDSASLIEAMKAVEDMAKPDAWPDGSEVEHSGRVTRV